MGTTSYSYLRSRVAVLSRKHAADEPVLIDARLSMNEAFVVEKIGKILDAGPALTPELRARIDASLAERQVEAGCLVDPDTIEAIRKRAMELAEAAPPLSTEQAALLLMLYRRYSKAASVGATQSTSSGIQTTRTTTSRKA